jgi:hypothetical protein
VAAIQVLHLPPVPFQVQVVVLGVMRPPLELRFLATPDTGCQAQVVAVILDLVPPLAMM